MNNLKLYCPECGSVLANRIGSSMYECINPSCTYKLNENNTIDISFSSKGLSKALSNLCPYPFEIDGVKCASMESFIQSLKVEDAKMQADVCSKTGPFCYSIREMFNDWRTTQTVYWKGKPINRQSDDYFLLLKEAYDKLLEQSPIFRYALTEVKKHNYSLTHSIGCTDKTQTLLTPDEYITLLEHLIKRYIN